ncbi:MAG: branched-chain amino acid ABC transporter permease [Oscillospiraceae bacterium]|nr:branched-chain amino acid ABC transporter permease [Oscillospiraceae bacterium]
MGLAKNMKSSFKPKDLTNYLIVGAILAVSLILKATGNLPRSSATLLTQIGFSIILAVSLNMVVGFLGELSLGHAGFMCVGAYIGCLAANGLKDVIDSPLLILIITMLIGGLVAAVFGFIIGLPALRLKGDYLAIVTLAFGEIVRNVFKNLKVFGGALGLRTTTYKGNLFVVAFAMVLITLFLVQNIIKSKHGRAITAIRDNEIAAKAMGVNVTYYKLFVFVMSAFFAGIAGVIYGHYASPVIYSFFSYNYSIEILVMVVLGGMGNIRGSIIAATLITYLNFQLQTRLSGDLAAIKFLVYAVILIVFIIFNNAPALKPLREKLSLRRIFSEKKLKKNPSSIKNDAAAWDKIPTKIEMDEMLSVDVTTESPYTPDKPEKKGERENG